MAKVLFVCHANAGRSQTAMELYNRLNPGEAESAGTEVDLPGEKLMYRIPARSALKVMQEIGIDMSENTRRQLYPEMLENFEKIIVMSEPELTPDYLNKCPRAERWEIEDMRYKSVDEARILRDQISANVDLLSLKLHSLQPVFN